MNSKSYSRKRSDYATIACLFGVLLGFSEALYLERSQTQDRIYILQACNLFGLSDETVIWAVWFLVAVLSLSGITSGLWFWMRSVNPAVTPETHFWRQFETISVNMFLLSAVQAFGDYCAYKFGVFKITRDHLDPWSILKDSFFWILCFELAWYTQHRMMHDVKFLWIYGHAYHHQWKKPEHMIGITNFAFDHIVEVYVTMSSSFLGYLLFPINFHVGKAISLGYMILAVLVHWDGFQLSRYHLNHHYLVNKNFGSHIPVFDILFGTYQAEFDNKL